jgi:hypothetical protein
MGSFFTSSLEAGGSREDTPTSPAQLSRTHIILVPGPKLPRDLSILPMPPFLSHPTVMPFKRPHVAAHLSERHFELLRRIKLIAHIHSYIEPRDAGCRTSVRAVSSTHLVDGGPIPEMHSYRMALRGPHGSGFGYDPYHHDYVV